MQNQHHAKVIVLSKDVTKRVQCLDENTVDYIEAHYVDIMLEETLGTAMEEKEFTCIAGSVDEPPPENANKQQ